MGHFVVLIQVTLQRRTEYSIVDSIIQSHMHHYVFIAGKIFCIQLKYKHVLGQGDSKNPCKQALVYGLDKLHLGNYLFV